jgi:hypothetical protein
VHSKPSRSRPSSRSAQFLRPESYLKDSLIHGQHKLIKLAVKFPNFLHCQPIQFLANIRSASEHSTAVTLHYMLVVASKQASSINKETLKSDQSPILVLTLAEATALKQLPPMTVSAKPPVSPTPDTSFCQPLFPGLRRLLDSAFVFKNTKVIARFEEAEVIAKTGFLLGPAGQVIPLLDSCHQLFFGQQLLQQLGCIQTSS